ncbi:MAG: hypothetical protein ACO3NK_17080 [Prochlorotrichaceae cyanobacterium]
MTTQTLHTIEQNLTDLCAALVRETRDDGSNFLRISDKHPRADELRDIVRQLHFGEFPNDWRYETIYDLAQKLLEYSEPSAETWDADDYTDVMPEIVDSLADSWCTDLLEWAKVGSRLDFDDPESIQESTDIAALLEERQREEIFNMGYTLVALLED